MISEDEHSPAERVARPPAEGSGEGIVGWLARQPENVAVRWVALSCVLLALGSLGTWARIQVDGLAVTASGLDGWGKLTLAAAVVTVVPVVQPDWIRAWRWGARHHLDVSLVLAWASLGACVYSLFGNDGYGLAGIESPGWGVYLATLASVSLVVWTIALRRASTPQRMARPLSTAS